MKRLHTLALALVAMVTAQAQDLTLTVAQGTNQVKVTLPAGEYIINEQNITSTGEELSVNLNGATEVSFKRADGTKLTALTAVNQKSIIGVKGNGSGLVSLDLHNNAIESFDYLPNISNGKLKSLFLSDNNLSKITFSGGRWNAIEVLDVSNNNLSTLALSALTSLKQLYCSSNHITALTPAACTKLNVLWCDDNEIKQLVLTSNTELESIVADNNVINKFTAPKDGLTKLVDLWLNDNKLETATLGSNALLNTLNVSNNDLTSITMSQTSSKLLFADFTGNRLTFSDLFSVSDVINYLYGPQRDFQFEKDIYIHGEDVFMPEIKDTNLSGNKLSLSTKWYNADTDEALKQGSKTNTTSDYYAAKANKQYQFKPQFSGRTYATISTSSMPNLVMRSEVIRIMSQEEYDGVDKLQSAGFTFNVLPGALRMNSQQPTNVMVVDLGGRIVWRGTVDQHGVQVNGLHGTYVVNGIKVAI